MSIELAEQYEENGQYNEAYEELKKSFEHSPKDLSLLAQLGHVAIILNKKEEAEDYYKRILALDATNPTAYEQLMDMYIETDKYQYYLCRGNYHIVQQQYEHALNDFQKAVNSAVGDEEKVAPTRFVLGTLYEQLGNNNKAIDEYLKVLDYENAEPDVYARLAALYEKDDILGSAIETLERAIAEGHETPDIREQLAALYFKDNNPAKAKETTQNDLMRIKSMLALGELEEAKTELDKISSKYANDPDLYSLKAEYYYTSKEYDEALKAVQTYSEKFPNHPLVFQMRALIYEAQNDEYMATLNWGKYNLVRGNKDISINEFLNAYQLKNDDADMIATLANLLETSGEKHQAMEFYEKLVKLEPNNSSALDKLSRYWEDNGDYRLAIEYLEQRLDADKRHFASMKKVAELYLKTRNTQAAIDWYKKYLQTAPQGEEYTEIETKLNKLERNNITPDTESESILDKVVGFFLKK